MGPRLERPKAIRLNMDNYASELNECLNRRNLPLDRFSDAVLVTIDRDLPTGWHHDSFDSKTKVAKDSGGFKLLMNPELSETFDVRALIERHKNIGFGNQDIIISADFPIPTGQPLSAGEKERRQVLSVDWFDTMRKEIPQTIPALHGQNLDEILHHKGMYGVDSEMVALGSNLAQTTPNVMGRLKNGKLKGKEVELTSRKDVWSRIFETLPALQTDVFLLGAGGMNAAPLAALIGAKAVDATSWRLNARMFSIFNTVNGRYVKCGESKNNLMATKNQEFLAMRLQDENYPFHGMRLKDLNRVFQSTGAKATEVREIHNVWEMKKDSEVYNEFEGDPEGLALLLEKRWRSSGWTDYQNIKRLSRAVDVAKSSTRELELFIA